MDRLWAPWRYKYVQGKMKGCLFCRVNKCRQEDRKNFVVHRSRFAFSILNIYPYNNGHIMVAPYKHAKNLMLLKDNEILDMMRLVAQTTDILNKLMHPDGFNIGINIGRQAGAGFAGHIHIHIVPRWDGDTNFMPVITSTKVISQSLKDLYKKMTNAYKKRHTTKGR
jgi:ATP adenylyltransferase